MKTYMLDLNSIDRVKGFVSAIEKFDGYFDIATGRYVVLSLIHISEPTRPEP